MSIFGKDGRLIIPLVERKGNAVVKKVNESKIRYILTEAFCPNGCNIVDKDNLINGYPGLRIKFKRPGMKGEFVISAIEGDFDKKILSGTLVEGAKHDLFCPHCSRMFEILVNCNCRSDAEMVVVGLTPALNFNDAITFCNVTGCSNGTFIQSGEVLRHVRLNAF